MSQREAPAVGPLPEWLWREHRLRELLQAIDKQYEKNLPDYDNIVLWTLEMYGHAKWLREAKK